MKNDDEQTRQTLKSFQEVLKRKLAAVKTLVVKYSYYQQNSWTSEIYSKAKLNLIQKHLNNSVKLENDTRTSK